MLDVVHPHQVTRETMGCETLPEALMRVCEVDKATAYAKLDQTGDH